MEEMIKLAAIEKYLRTKSEMFEVFLSQESDEKRKKYWYGRFKETASAANLLRDAILKEIIK